MNRSKFGSRFAVYHRSIWFASCSGLGLWAGYMDGFGLVALIQTAIILSLIMAFYFGVLTLWQYIVQKRSKRNPF